MSTEQNFFVIETSRETSISFQPLGRNMTWSSWSCCYPHVGRSDTHEFIEKTVSTLCTGHFSQELSNQSSMKKGTYWTRAWIYALLGATNWKDAKTWWRCMSGTICWRSPQPAKCNTQFSWMSFLFFFLFDDDSKCSTKFSWMCFLFFVQTFANAKLLMTQSATHWFLR